MENRIIFNKEEVDDESILNMIISENILKKDWNNKYDERWNIPS